MLPADAERDSRSPIPRWQAWVAVSLIVLSLGGIFYSLRISQGGPTGSTAALSYWPWHWLIIFSWCTWALCLRVVRKESGGVGYRLGVPWPLCAALMLAVPAALYLICVALRASLDEFALAGMLLLFVPALLPDQIKEWVARTISGWRSSFRSKT